MRYGKVLAAVAVTLLLVGFVLWLRDHDDLTVPNPRHLHPPSKHEPLELPALVRYLPRQPGDGRGIRWGLVLRARDGVPEEIVDLERAIPGLGGGLEELLERDGFAAAESLWSQAKAGNIDPTWIERLTPDSLTARVLAPLDTTLAQLASRERLIVGVGLNYAEHAADVAQQAAEDAFAFAKMVEPTGAYSSVRLGPAEIPGQEYASLIDYEVELAFVVLEDLALDALPAADELAEHIAWVQANDVTNRLPILLEGDAGFTQAKSQPTFLPLGPWLVHGRHLRPRTAAGGEDAVSLSLRVEEERPHERGSQRQHSSSQEMVRGPREILELIVKNWPQSERPDADGIPRGVVRIGDGRPMIPRGSLILTGTPGGTAIEAPGGLDRARLFMLGNLSPRAAREEFALHCVRHRLEMGFLSPGDVVDAQIDYLGRQRWVVVR